jgi:hypothetical protein
VEACFVSDSERVTAGRTIDRYTSVHAHGHKKIKTN